MTGATLHAVLTAGLGPATALAARLKLLIPTAFERVAAMLKPAAVTRTYSGGLVPGANGSSVLENSIVRLIPGAPDSSGVFEALIENRLLAAAVACEVEPVVSRPLAADRAAASTVVCRRDLFSV